MPTGFSTDGTNWFSGQDYPPQRLGPSAGRSHVGSKGIATEDMPREYMEDHFPPPQRPKRLLSTGASIFSATPPVEYGDLDDTYSPVWIMHPAWPKRLIDRGRERTVQIEMSLIEAQQNYLNLSSDDVPLFVGAHVRQRKPQYPTSTGKAGQSEHWFFTDPEILISPWALQCRPPGRGPERRQMRPFALGEWGKESSVYDGEIEIGWQAPTGYRPRGLPLSGRGVLNQGGSAHQPHITVPTTEEELYVSAFPLYQRPRQDLNQWSQYRRERYHYPPWLGAISLVVSGPFICIAGQVSQYAGAVVGEVKSGGKS